MEQICFYLWGKQHRDPSSSIFLNRVPPPGPDSQWMDFVNGSDVQKGTWTLAAAFSGSYNSVGSLQSSQEPVNSRPLALGQGKTVAQCWKAGWTAWKSCLLVRKEQWQIKNKIKNLSTQGEDCSVGRNIHSDEAEVWMEESNFIIVWQRGFKNENEKQKIENFSTKW